ncbi:hypothetical protein TCA2_0692 [Paenibacillus sp. TCA20]|nr:hypothetical protein TCA2_0692 [Paenibacillus sp. TCA20]
MLFSMILSVIVVSSFITPSFICLGDIILYYNKLIPNLRMFRPEDEACIGIRQKTITFNEIFRTF